MNALLLDTNVWLDEYLGIRPGNAAAHDLIDEAVKRSVPLLYSVTTSSDLHYLIAAGWKQAYREAHGGLLTQEAALAAQAIAWSCLENMMEMATAVGCDESDLWLARKQRPLHGDYEDDLIIAAAIRANALLVSNDEKLVAHCPVAAMSAADALTYLKAIAAPR